MSKTIDFTISLVKRCLTTVIKSLTPIPNISTLVSAKSVFEIPFLFEHSLQK
jgi:hypothetical protein